MKIYTKTGDQGDTQIYADKVVRLPKSDNVLECYGTLDELNAHIGMLISMINQPDTDTYLQTIQQHLFQIGFAISATSHLAERDLTLLETEIDKMQEQTPAQTSFILPGGAQAACQAHICRTVARRAERRLVSLMPEHDVPSLTLSYINRLSDYFFVQARYLNHQAGATEVKV